MVNVRKRGKVFQYQFEIAPVDGVRKYINKSGFKTKAEAEKAGIIAYNEYTQTGHNFTPNKCPIQIIWIIGLKSIVRLI